MPVFNSVILDVDSTVAAIEGIDWLAERRGPEVAARVAEATERAMRGEIALDAVYGERLALVKPGRDELAALAEAYLAAAVPGAAETVARLREAGVRVALVSGGVRQAILPLARALGVDLRDVHAVDVVVDMGGGYFAFDAGSPLTTQHGKRDVAERMVAGALGAPPLPRPVLAVGDGATDLAMKPAVDSFAAFTGVATRDAVVRGADHVLDSFPALAALVLS